MAKKYEQLPNPKGVRGNLDEQFYFLSRNSLSAGDLNYRGIPAEFKRPFKFLHLRRRFQ